jgi:hypothetical protein
MSDKMTVKRRTRFGCGFRFDPATHSKSYPATIPIIIRPAFRPLSGHLF